ncbi:MAG TPA: DinB family protein, partial [Actinoplanes sp.]|nr:DinB family protein [Actinoplanes sp.]
MPGQTRPVSDERDGLLSFLAQIRYQLKLTGYGLTPEQLRAVPSASELSVGGLMKHCAYTEAGWIDTAVQRPPTHTAAYEWDQHFDVAEGETYEDIVTFYDEVAAETERVVAGVADLGAPVPIDKSVPWNPREYDNWSVRWVLFHLIQETARHC